MLRSEKTVSGLIAATQRIHASIDRMAELAQIEVLKDGVRARCAIDGIVEWHNRSMAQKRRFRNKQRIEKLGGSK